MEAPTTIPRQSPVEHLDRGERLLTDVQAAALLGLRPQTLRGWRHESNRGGELRGPRFIRLGMRAIRYRLSDLRAYLDTCQRSTDAALRD